MKPIKILSWNQQGYGGASEKASRIRWKLMSGEYDIICLQEAGHVLNSFMYDGSIQTRTYNTRKTKTIDKYKPQPIHSKHNVLSQYEAYYVNYGRCSLVTYIKKCDKFSIEKVDLIPFFSS